MALSTDLDFNPRKKRQAISVAGEASLPNLYEVSEPTCSWPSRDSRGRDSNVGPAVVGDLDFSIQS